jgi:hypothetical protein
MIFAEFLRLPLAASRKAAPVTGSGCHHLKVLFDQTKTFMQIFGKLHGFSISTVLCWSTTERKQVERFSFVGDEYESIEQDESLVL